MTGQQYVAEARQWIGTPFLHAAAEKGKGCDCIGLVVGAAAAIGMEVPLLPEYGGWVALDAMVEIAQVWGFPVGLESPWQAGDVLQIAIRGNPQHFGIYSGEQTFIHAGFKVVRETRLDERWWPKISYVWRWKELTCRS